MSDALLQWCEDGAELLGQVMQRRPLSQEELLALNLVNKLRWANQARAEKAAAPWKFYAARQAAGGEE